MTYSKEEIEEQRQAHAKIIDIFKGRCAYHLAHKAVAVHEIEPRSARPSDWWKDLDNMIPLCNEIHRQVHEEGWRNWVDVLRERRTKALKIISPDWVRGIEP